MTDLQPAAPPVPDIPEDVTVRAAAPVVPSPAPPPASPAAPPKTSATKRVRARLARRMSPQRPGAVAPVLEPLATVHRIAAPEGGPGAAAARLRRRRRPARGPEAQVRRSVHHPPAGRGDDPGRAGHGHHDAGRGAAARHRRGHRLLAGAAARRVRRGGGAPRRRRHQAGQGRAGQRGRRPRPSARWSSRWPATRGCWSSSSRPAAQHAHDALPLRRRSRRRRRGRRSRCSPRWRTGSGWPRSSGSWRTCPSRSCTRRSTRRSSGWSPTGRRRGTPTSSRSSTRSPSSSTRREITATVEGRPKHYYSIYQKMIVKGRDFDDIHDLVGVRVLVDEVRDCYAAMGMVHALWQPMPGRFKDYIAQPRFGMYQSLHTTVIGPDGKPLEVQIRTHEMHRTAEYGIAAHWRYKESQAAPRPAAASAGRRRRDGVDAPAARLAAGGGGPRRVPGVAALRPAAQEIFVFTPKGDVITLPTGSTPVDFAYAVHTEVGHRCIGARVNGRLVALERQARERRRRRDLHVARPRRPGRRRTGCVRRVAAGQDQDPAVVRQGAPRGGHRGRQGRDHPRGAQRPAAAAAAAVGGRDGDAGPRAALTPDVSALYAAVGEGHVSARHVVQRLVALLGGVEERRGGPRRAGDAVDGPPAHSPSATPGSWCAATTVPSTGSAPSSPSAARPVPGDDILGFVTRGGGVSVHRTDCTNAGDLQAQAGAARRRRVGAVAASVFLVAIQVEALDRHRLLSDVTQGAGRREGQHPVGVGADLARPGGRQPVHLRDGRPQAPRHLLQAVRNVEGVYDVYRVTSARLSRASRPRGRPSPRTTVHGDRGRLDLDRRASACRHPSRCRRPCPRRRPCRSWPGRRRRSCRRRCTAAAASSRA